jgi:hypothetical protein
MERGTLRANGFKDVQNGFFVESAQAAGGPDANALTKQLNHLMQFAGFDAQAVQRLLFGKRLTATDTAEAFNDTVFITEIGKVFGFAGAAMAFQLAFLGKES